MTKYLAAAFILFLVHGHAFAQAQDSCKEVTEINDLRANDPYSLWLRDCDCGQELEQKYKVTGPDKMSLIGVCGYRPENYSGFFYFKGNALVEGEIKRNDYVSGTELLFVAPRKQREEIFNTLDLRDDLRVLDFSGASEFNPPELTGDTECWKAVTRVKITELAVAMGDGDAAGSFPMEFQVLSLSDYEECEAEL